MEFARGTKCVGTLDTAVIVFVAEVLHTHLYFVMEMEQGSWRIISRKIRGLSSHLC